MAILDIRGVTVLFDDEDAELVARHKWWITPQGYAVTKIRRTDGLKKDKGRRTIGMHRLILGDPETPSIDHINREKLDNRKENLCSCTVSTNNKNVCTRANKASKYRGVSRMRDRWQVVIRVNGKLKWFGSYATEEEAAQVAAPHFYGIEP